MATTAVLATMNNYNVLVQGLVQNGDVAAPLGRLPRGELTGPEQSSASDRNGGEPTIKLQASFRRHVSLSRPGGVVDDEAGEPKESTDAHPSRP